jgi:uncharacterized SAM-binding protein YcdF (DUF218 family)
VTTRRAGVLLFVLLVFGGWQFFRNLGHLLHYEDPLERADVIYVLGGTRMERVAEGGQLYLEGWAPLVLLSRQVSEPAEVRLRAAGLRIPTETELQRDVLIQMRLPPEAIAEVSAEQVATADEVKELAQFARAKGWTRVIVVTSKLHTARARLAMRRALEPGGIRVLMRASRYDDADLAAWWSNRSDFRFVLFEAQKLLAYSLGIGD